MRQDAAIQYRFGRFVVQPRERRLLVDGQPVLAGPRAFDVLLALIERAGQLVTKDELLGRVWPKLIVEENNLQVQVSALRKILGQDAIVTIPGQGYRFTPVAKLIEGEIADFALAHTHNLPQPLTSFVGHENDLAEYAQMLRETRLLTLTGIGGCGKTRLAIELARSVLPSFPDGVRFVDLAPVTEADRVATAVAVALEVRELVDQPVEETLVRHVADRRLLIVLDNCEHLLDACAALVERLLTAAPGIRALITSREGFGIAGERIMRVRSLALPSPTAAADCEVIGMFESVRLFLDRVRHVAVDFVLSESNAGAIADICRRLDGIPLALELAAARVKLLSVEQIRERLDDRFRLLTGNSRAMSRHQTLLATLQWSYEHLAPDQQRLLRRLSVFSDGWTLDGAIRVGGAPKHTLDARQHLSRIEGFWNIVVGAHLEADDTIDHGRGRRQHDDRDCRITLAQVTREAQAVLARHANVEKRQVDRLFCDQRLGSSRVLRTERGVTMPDQVLQEHFANVGLVVDDQDRAVWNHGASLFCQRVRSGTQGGVGVEQWSGSYIHRGRIRPRTSDCRTLRQR